MKRNLSRSEIITGVVLTVLSVTISLGAHFKTPFPGDLGIARFLQSNHSNWLRTAMEGVSYISGGWPAAILVVVSCIVLWRWVGKLEGLFMAAVGLATLFAELLKILINRPRPSADVVTIYVYESSKSFPSGHAFFALVFFGMFAYLAASFLHKTGLKILIISLLSILIFGVGISRVYLGTHLASDVVGGYIIGGWFLMSLIWLYQVLKPRFVTRTS